MQYAFFRTIPAGLFMTWPRGGLRSMQSRPWALVGQPLDS